MAAKTDTRRRRDRNRIPLIHVYEGLNYARCMSSGVYDSMYYCCPLFINLRAGTKLVACHWHTARPIQTPGRCMHHYVTPRRIGNGAVQRTLSVLLINFVCQPAGPGVCLLRVLEDRNGSRCFSQWRRRISCISEVVPMLTDNRLNPIDPSLKFRSETRQSAKWIFRRYARTRCCVAHARKYF